MKVLIAAFLLVFSTLGHSSSNCNALAKFETQGSLFVVYLTDKVEAEEYEFIEGDSLAFSRGNCAEVFLDRLESDPGSGVLYAELFDEDKVRVKYVLDPLYFDDYKTHIPYDLWERITRELKARSSYLKTSIEKIGKTRSFSFVLKEAIK